MIPTAGVAWLHTNHVGTKCFMRQKRHDLSRNLVEVRNVGKNESIVMSTSSCHGYTGLRRLNRGKREKTCYYISCTCYLGSWEKVTVARVWRMGEWWSSMGVCEVSGSLRGGKKEEYGRTPFTILSSWMLVIQRKYKPEIDRSRAAEEETMTRWSAASQKRKRGIGRRRGERRR